MDKELKKLTDHHAFIVTTDRKSLYTTIKNLVHQAEEAAGKELNQRRNTLKLLLDHEDKIYEEEFANKVKSRIDEDIKERKDVLLKIKEESKRNEMEFLQTKRIQQYMNSCYEIREALRYKETQNIKECQFEQMLEKERAFKREQDLGKYWQKVQDSNLRVLDQRQQEENCLRKALVKNVSEARKIQLKEMEEKRNEILQEKAKEKAKLQAHLEKLRLEEFDLKVQGKPLRVKEYRHELFKQMEEKKQREDNERQEEAERHRKLMAEIACIEAEEKTKNKQKKLAFYQATMEFIRFVKGMRQLEDQQHQMYSDRIDDLRRVDQCTKQNILRERQHKARKAEQCFAELRKQINEQCERRLREELEYKENKILENRFAHDETSRQEILAQRQAHRRELDKQIEELKNIREAEAVKFSDDIRRASNDPEFCSQLAEKCIREGIDYLEPHANWRICACPNKIYIPKPPAQSLEELMGQGVIPKSTGQKVMYMGQEAIPKTKVETCNCIAMGRSNCGKDGRGDEEM